MTGTQIRFPRPVWRIALRWTAEGWEVERRTRVESMTLPAFVGSTGGEGGPSWYELYDADGAELYRHRVDEPPRTAYLSDGSHTGLEVDPDDLVVEVLVPEVDGAVELQVYSARLPTSPGVAQEKAAAPLVAMFRMDDLTAGGSR